MEEKISRAELDEAKGVCRTLFTNDKGQPFELVDGQAELFLEIWKKKHFRVHVQTTTRYGKSEVISMAVLTRACTVPEH